MQQIQLKHDGEARAPAPVQFQIRSRSFTAIVLPVAKAADESFLAALDARLRLAPHFFANAPFVLDLDGATGLTRSGDFTGLMRELRARNLAIVGVQNGSLEQNAAAAAAGVMPLPTGREPAPPRPAPAEAAPPAGATVIAEPVRSGQRVVAPRGDLVVIGPVSAGAELIARGNVHVYGALRGRALAGVDGDAAARIFCQSLEAELVAVAGLYRTSEALEPLWRSRAQVFRDGEALRVEALK